MITGFFDHRGRAFVRCHLTIPRLSITGVVEFRVDTGADGTALHPGASTLLGIPFDRLEIRTARVANGLGGQIVYFQEPAQLLFDDDVRGLERRDVNLLIAEPILRNAALPSLLGLNVLNNWRMNFDPRNELLQFFA